MSAGVEVNGAIEILRFAQDDKPSSENSLVEGGAEFEDTGADGFDGDGKGEGGGFVDEEDDAVEFAFAGASGKGEAEGMEEITAADFEGGFELGDDFLEAVGGEGSGVKKK